MYQRYEQQLIGYIVNSVKLYLDDKKYLLQQAPPSKEDIKAIIVAKGIANAGTSGVWCVEDVLADITNKEWDFIPEPFVYSPPDSTKCDCGARHTSIPDDHSQWCLSLMEDTEVIPKEAVYENNWSFW